MFQTNFVQKLKTHKLRFKYVACFVFQYLETITVKTPAPVDMKYAL